ncbi:MAG: hypothetical protein U5R48_14915 [Gammaproteobacteria bacterium]|nr:hypothetical protein [Gammaproteobacteria bacterium]
MTGSNGSETSLDVRRRDRRSEHRPPGSAASAPSRPLRLRPDPRAIDNGNSIRGIVSGEVALGNLTDATGDISIVTTAGTLQQADDTRILAQQGNVRLSPAWTGSGYSTCAPNRAASCCRCSIRAPTRTRRG